MLLSKLFFADVSLLAFFTWEHKSLVFGRVHYPPYVECLTAVLKQHGLIILNTIKMKPHKIHKVPENIFESLELRER